MESKLRLTDRDFALLRALHHYTVLSHSQVSRWFFDGLSRPTVSNRLIKLEKSGYIRSLQVGILLHHGQKHRVQKIYAVTKRALKILQFKFPEEKFRDSPLPFNTQTIHHDLCLNEVIHRLKSRKPEVTISHGRLLKFSTTDRTRVPDAVTDSPDGPGATAIELELTAKSETRYREIILSYRLSRRYSKVLYIVANDAIRNKLMYAVTGYRARPNLPPPDMSPFEIVSLKEWI